MAHELTAVGIIGSKPVRAGIATPLATADYGVTLGTRNPAAKKFRDFLPATAMTAHADPGDMKAMLNRAGR